MYAVMIVASFIVATYSVYAWLLWSRNSKPEQWDNAPLAAGVVYFVIWSWPAITDPSTNRLLGLVGTSVFFILFGWLVMLTLEEYIMEPPEEIPSLEERWPNWLVRGLWGDEYEPE